MNIEYSISEFIPLCTEIIELKCFCFLAKGDNCACLNQSLCLLTDLCMLNSNLAFALLLFLGQAVTTENVFCKLLL